MSTQTPPIVDDFAKLLEKFAGPAVLPAFELSLGPAEGAGSVSWQGECTSGFLQGYRVNVNATYAGSWGWTLVGTLQLMPHGTPATPGALAKQLGTGVETLLQVVQPPGGSTFQVASIKVVASGFGLSLSDGGDLSLEVSFLPIGLDLPQWFSPEGLGVSVYALVGRNADGTVTLTDLSFELLGTVALRAGRQTMLLDLDVAIDQETGSDGTHQTTWVASVSWKVADEDDGYGLGDLLSALGLKTALPTPLTALHLLALSGSYRSADKSFTAELQFEAQNCFTGDLSLEHTASGVACEVNLLFTPALGLEEAAKPVVDAAHLDLSQFKNLFGNLDLKLHSATLSHAQGGWAVSLAGEVDVDGVALQVTVEHAGPDLGWQIEALWTGQSNLSLDSLAPSLPREIKALFAISLDRASLCWDSLTGSAGILVSGTLTKDNYPAVLTATRSRGPAGPAAWDMQGLVLIEGAQLNLHFAKPATGTPTPPALLVAGFCNKPSDKDTGGLTLANALHAIAVNAPDLRLGVQSVLIAKAETSSPPSASYMLAAADLACEISSDTLHRIPVLGERLSSDAKFGLAVRVIYASTAISPADVSAIRTIALSGTPTLPDSVAQGFNSSSVSLQIGSKTIEISGVKPALPAVGQNPPVNSPADATPPPVPVHQNLGGVLDLRSVRPSVSDGALTLAVDGSVRFGPLTLDVIGLSIGYNLKEHQPTPPALRGLSLLLDKPPVRIEGGFLLVPATKDSPPDFVGKAEITTASFSLTALGGFTMIGGSPSLFVYGVLNLPLGGPPFFFVEGLAAGFGINRHLTPPGINDVETFPLVQAALPAPQAALPAPQAALPAPIDLPKLHQSLNPQLGSLFFAVGVKFTSFRLIHGFLLAIVAIDTASHEFEVALIGTGEWVSPPEATGDERMSYVRLDIVAAYSSRDGSLLLQAQLGPDCFVSDPLCHVSGGMALGSWLAGEHAGDFVFTIGGYHPAFAVPKHYPVPGRVTITYEISSEIHAGGSLYFALTPNNLMFGLAFNATWHTGPVRAWFDLGLDFLMKFKPLHYDATGHLDIGASVDLLLCTISVSAGADLHLWGPPIGGSAVVHLGPFHGQLSFGSPMAPPPPLSNIEFQTSFLPKDPNSALSICPAGGLRTTTTASDQKPPYWSFNPKDLVLTVESLIPLDTPVSVPPMSTATQSATFTFTLQATFYRQQENSSWTEYTDATPSPTASKRFPPALWKAESGAAKLSAGLTYKGGARPLAGNLSPHLRRDLSKGQKANQQTPAVRNARPLPDQHHRDFKARGNDLSLYEKQPSAANAAFLDSLAIQLKDPALRASRHTDRPPAVSLLDPPRLITLR